MHMPNHKFGHKTLSVWTSQVDYWPPFWPIQLVACRYRSRWVSDNRNILKALPFNIKRWGVWQVYSEKLRLWWLTRNWQGIAAVFQSSIIYARNKISPPGLGRISVLFLIPAITLLHFYRSQLATNIFLVSFGWEWSADATMIILLLNSWIRQLHLKGKSSECGSCLWQ